MAERRGRSLFKAAGDKFDDRLNLLAVRPFEPLHDVIEAGACFYILKDDRDGHARALKHPGAAYLSRDAFHRGALSPIQRCHGRILLSIILYLFAGQGGYQCALNNVKWVMKGGAVVADKTKGQVR